MDRRPESKRVALVTGGAKRVGRAIVERLAEAGFDIAFTFHQSSGDAVSLERQLQEMGRTVVAAPVDLTDPAKAVAALHAAVTSRFGRLDVLVNNASMYLPGKLQEVT